MIRLFGNCIDGICDCKRFPTCFMKHQCASSEYQRTSANRRIGNPHRCICKHGHCRKCYRLISRKGCMIGFAMLCIWQNIGILIMKHLNFNWLTCRKGNNPCPYFTIISKGESEYRLVWEFTWRGNHWRCWNRHLCFL
jgi:hypothetical protein